MDTIARTHRLNATAVRRAIVAVALAMAALVGLNTHPASAAVHSSAGPVGYVTYYPVNSFSSSVFATGALYPTPTPSLNIPGVTAYRGAFSGYQYVKQTVVVQKYINNRWTNVTLPLQQTRVLGTTYSYAKFTETQLALGSGFYSVTIAVSWNNQYGQVVAVSTLAYHHSSDYSCRYGGCWAGPGYIAI